MDKSEWAVILGVGAAVMVLALCALGLLLAAGFWALTNHGGMMGGGCSWCSGTGALGGGPLVGGSTLITHRPSSSKNHLKRHANRPFVEQLYGRIP